MTRNSNSNANGFSMVELVAVMAILVIISAFALPAVNGMLRGSQMSQAGRTIVDQLNGARQAAISRNRMVEVRLYAFGENGEPKDAWKVRALQAYEISSDGRIQPMSKVQRLPASVIIDSGRTLSSLLDAAKRTVTDGVESLPGPGIDYRYFYIRFRPDGTTDLDANASEKWFLTIHDISDGEQLTTPPKNFTTVQIDAVSGNIESFRP